MMMMMMVMVMVMMIVQTATLDLRIDGMLRYLYSIVDWNIDESHLSDGGRCFDTWFPIHWYRHISNGEDWWMKQRTSTTESQVSS